LPRSVPPGPVRLTLTATAADGAVASHRLLVLGQPDLPLSVARASLAAAVNETGGDVVTGVHRCRTLTARRVVCRAFIASESETSRYRMPVTLRPDGWLWTSYDKRPPFRIETLARW
jgi:hypothetical protein